MGKPKLRHLAIISSNPRKLAEFYNQVFEMEILHTDHEEGFGDCVYMTDGYINLAILPYSVDNGIPTGLNHFGFVIEDLGETSKRMVAHGARQPKANKPNRPYAEHKGRDIEGNSFDLSVHGYQRVETGDDRAKQKVPA